LISSPGFGFPDITEGKAISGANALEGADEELLGGASAATGEGEFANLASEARTGHILHGDATGGGHLWPGAVGKTPFPEGWSEGKIMQAVSDIATDPALECKQITGEAGAEFTKSGKPVRYAVTGERYGQRIRVIIELLAGIGWAQLGL
jgi:hypothetical protein